MLYLEGISFTENGNVTLDIPLHALAQVLWVKKHCPLVVKQMA